MSDRLAKKGSSCRVLRGDVVADRVFKYCQKDVEAFVKKYQIRPSLKVLRVGNDPSSKLYVERKKSRALSLGIDFEEVTFPSETSFALLKKTIHDLNQNKRVHAIILQLPLPGHLMADALVAMIDPLKDVDGLHPFNRGLLFGDREEKEFLVPCTPWGCLELCKYYDVPLAGKHVVIMGRSILVGRPLAALFLKHQASVTLVHSRSENIKAITSQADILCVAIGKAEFVDASYIKKGCVVLDIGIHHIKGAVVGDINFEAMRDKALAISPVPGGVGPLTVMGLMHNTLKAAFNQCASFN